MKIILKKSTQMKKRIGLVSLCLMGVFIILIQKKYPNKQDIVRITLKAADAYHLEKFCKAIRNR